VNEALRAVRLSAKKTQKQVASEIGVVREAYQRYELGTRLPNIITGLKLADVFGITSIADLKEIFISIPREQAKPKEGDSFL
jgi:DNA-binding XRE family transcriptional regulator